MEPALPRDLDHLWRLWRERPTARVYAGGTDLLVGLRRRRETPPPLICLERVAELKTVEQRGEEVFLGAGLTHAELLRHPLVRRRLPVLASALATLGSPPIRNMGTLGGNLVTASPAGDTLPPLHVLGARVEMVSARGARALPLADFILGPGRNALGTEELVLGVRLPLPSLGCVQHFEKVGRRAALAISLVSLAALVKLAPDGLVREARLAWGSVGPTVVVSRSAAAVLKGMPLDRQSLTRAAALAREEVSPIDDGRASADYRRQVAGDLLLRLSTMAPSFPAAG
jgi:CO/xanthine dehydrogenase FAD-binding subunit